MFKSEMYRNKATTMPRGRGGSGRSSPSRGGSPSRSPSRGVPSRGPSRGHTSPSRGRVSPSRGPSRASPPRNNVGRSHLPSGGGWRGHGGGYATYGPGYRGKRNGYGYYPGRYRPGYYVPYRGNYYYYNPLMVVAGAAIGTVLYNNTTVDLYSYPCYGNPECVAATYGPQYLVYL